MLETSNSENLLPPLPSVDVAMLKTKNLNKLLSQNTSPHITSAIILTPAGSLIASSHSPTSPKTLRTQTTLAANIWCTYAATVLPSSSPTEPIFPSDRSPTSPQPQLKSLTLELSTSNLHITQIRPRLLLCLIGPASISAAGGGEVGGVGVGGVSTRPGSEGKGGTPPPPSGEGDAVPTPPPSHHAHPTYQTAAGGGGGSSSRGSSAGKQRAQLGSAGEEISALGILRTRGEGLARWLEGELEGFEMPEMM